MDASSISAAKAQDLQTQVDVAALRHAQRQQKIEGEAALRLIECATAPVRTRGPAETGGLIDVAA